MYKSGDQFVQSFARGLIVIRCFGQNSKTMTIAEMAEQAGLTRAGARRILLTLQTLGYVRKENRRFSLTPKILDLGFAYLSSLEFWNFAQPIVEDLVAKVHETSSIGVLDGTDVVFVIRVPTRKILTTNITIGSRLLAYANSMGRILLGGFPPEELDHYFENVDLKSFTRRTVTDVALLRKIIAEGRRKGWIWISGEMEEGACGIAVPLIDYNGRIIASINVVFNSVRYSKIKSIKLFLPELQRAAEKINSRLKMGGINVMSRRRLYNEFSPSLAVPDLNAHQN